MVQHAIVDHAAKLDTRRKLRLHPNGVFLARRLSGWRRAPHQRLKPRPWAPERHDVA
jgi:hypothetical protein